MRYLLPFILVLFFAADYNAQTRTPVVSKVTATWCSRCGTYGWDFFEEMKELYGEGDQAVLLGVHYSGDLRNSTAEWFADNLNFFGQPLFYVDNENLAVSTNGWQNQIADFETKIEEVNNEATASMFSFINAYIDGNEIITNINFNPFDSSTEDRYFAIYVFENNVLNFQSQRGEVQHPNVLRDVMSSNPYGDLYASVGDESIADDWQQEYRMELNNNWSPNQLGLLAIVWRKMGDTYIVDNSQAVFGIGRLSSNEILLEDNILTLRQASKQLNVSVDNNGETYSLEIIGLDGRLIHSATSNNYEELIDLSAYPQGLYGLKLTMNNKYLTKQFFLD